MPPGRGGQELALSLKDQLALGRVLHRFLTSQLPDGGQQAYTNYTALFIGSGGIPEWLRFYGTVEINRDDELDAINRARGERQQ